LSSTSAHIILIGMPGSGKSTLGHRLAERLRRPFIDTDALIEQTSGHTLQAYIDQAGPDAFAELEESVGLRLQPQQPSVIATGGSMVYSLPAMQHLRALGRVVFLDVPLPQLHQRVGSGQGRGLLQRGEGGLDALYAERRPLYLRHAHQVVTLDAGDPDQHVEQVLHSLLP
jgi:shikimate kinase